jgi:hypothetical protein
MYLREPLYPFAIRRALPIRLTAVLCALCVIGLFFAPSFVIRSNLNNKPVPVVHPEITSAANVR